MIATAAEANPSCFSPIPLVDVHRTLVPSYLRIVSSAMVLLLKHRTNRSRSRDIWATTGETLNSAVSSSAETMFSIRERRKRSSRTSSPKPSLTTTWTMWRETGL